METLDQIVTFTCNLTLGGSAFYIGTSLVLYLTKRWNELEPKPKAIQIPLALKEQQTEILELPAAEPVRLREFQPAETESAVEPDPSLQAIEPPKRLK